MARTRPLHPPQATAEGRVAFRVRAPKANEILLRGQWTKEAIPLVRGEKDDWSATVEKIPAGFGNTASRWMDERARRTQPRVQAAAEPQKSILHIPSTPPRHGTGRTFRTARCTATVMHRKPSGARARYSSIRPPATNATPRIYPLLVLQHGSGDNYRTWLRTERRTGFSTASSRRERRAR
jgi:hypothetical protein